MAGLVLIVEDDELSARLLIDLLEIDGWQWLLDTDGRNALDLLRQHRPALAVMDIRLDRTLAHDLIRRIKADPEVADIPILVVTACVMPKEVAAIRATGADEYMAKPISITAFRQAIRRLADRSAAPIGTRGQEDE